MKFLRYRSFARGPFLACRFSVLKKGLGTRLLLYIIQQENATTRECNMRMQQQENATTWECNKRMQQEFATTRECNNKQHENATRECNNKRMQQQFATWECNKRMQQQNATRECNKRMQQQENATTRESISLVAQIILCLNTKCVSCYCFRIW